jgi:hypothetical protein
VTDAALRRCVGSEDVTDGLAQCLGAIEDAEHALADIESAVVGLPEEAARAALLSGVSSGRAKPPDPPASRFLIEGLVCKRSP